MCLTYVIVDRYTGACERASCCGKLLRRQYVIGWRDSLAFPIVCACCGGPGRHDALQPRCPRLLRARLVEGVTTPSACQRYAGGVAAAGSGMVEGGYGNARIPAIAYTPLGYSGISPPIFRFTPFGSTVRRGARVCVAFSCFRLGRFSRYNWEYMCRI